MKSIRSDLSRLKLVLFCALAFGLAAHAYMFFTFAPSHDGMMYLLATDDEVTLQISNGRFMQPVYWLLRGRIPVPWLVGLLSLLYIAASSYMIVSVLGIERRLSLVLLCGLLATDVTVTATNATYIYTVDTYMLALLLASAGAWLWERLPRWGVLAAVPLFACSMGLYQAYIDVAIGLALLLMMRRIMDGEPFSGLWKRALRYGLSLLAGAALYYALVKLILALTGVAMSNNYNSLNNLLENNVASMLRLVPDAYSDLSDQLLSSSRSFNTTAIILCRSLIGLLGLALWVRCVRVRRIRGLALLSLLLCAALLPLGLNFVYVLSAGETHGLMTYSFVLVYALVLLPLELTGPSGRMVSGGRRLMACLCAYAVLFNVVSANSCYYKKQLIYESASQYVYSVVEAMERDPAYEPGVTPVAIVGTFSLSYAAWDSDGLFQQYHDITGMSRNSSITYIDTFPAYCQFVLGHRANVIMDDAQRLEIQYRRSTMLMPVFPQEGFCQMQDGVMVVKIENVIYPS